MRTVTLGGDRIGSGNDMKVGLKGFERSTHNLSYTFKTTMAAGTLVPFLCELGLPGDTFDIELDCNVKTHPTIGPLFDTYKVQLDLYKFDWRLYIGKLHNNKLRAGLNIASIQLPVMKLFAFKSQNTAPDLNTSQINPSCILSYFDIRGVGYVDNAESSTAKPRNFQALKLLGYWDIYKNYYANKQELTGAVIHNVRPTINATVDTVTILNPPSYTPVTLPLDPATPSVVPIGPGTLIRLNYTSPALPPNPETIMVNQNGTYVNIMSLFAYPTVTATYVQLVWNMSGSPTTIEQWRYIVAADIVPTAPQVHRFPLDDIDDMREAILGWTQNNTPFIVNDASLQPYEFIALDFTPTTDYDLTYTLNQEGLGVKTYQSDLLNNWLRTEDIIGTGSITELTTIDTTGGLTMDQLNLQKKVYTMLSRIVAAGNSYDDYINAAYAHDRNGNPEIPVYCGGLSKELVFSEIISNAETSDQPLGTLAGRGIMGHKHKGGKAHIKCDEFCYIMGIISLTPRIVNSQGNRWDNELQTLDDVHKPDLDGIGYQGLRTDKMAWWDMRYQNGGWEGKIAGFQPAWVDYMSNVNRTYGNFAIQDNEMFMTLNRRYEYDPVGEKIKDLTTYIDPGKFNHIFAQTSLDAQNFWVQVAVNNIARRKMSAKQIPNL